jgi:hypothetical protein
MQSSPHCHGNYHKTLGRRKLGVASRHGTFVANRSKEIINTKPAGAASPTSYTYDGRNQLTAITDTAAGNTAISYDSQDNPRFSIRRVFDAI